MRHSKLARTIVSRAEKLQHDVEPGDSDELSLLDVLAQDLWKQGLLSGRDAEWIQSEVDRLWEEVNSSILSQEEGERDD